MKFLLTSAGLQNNTIAQALFDLAGKPASDINFTFIPTAANMEQGDKGWLIDDLKNIQKQGFKSIAIVDIAAVEKEIWLPQLEMADIICFGGGNQQYLARIIREQGVKEILADLLKTKVYMGISAGSMVTGTFIAKELLNAIYPEEAFDEELETPLEFLDLCFIPHLNSPYFDRSREETLEPMKPKLQQTVYATDDETAVQVVDESISIIGDGATWVFEK